MVTTTAELKVFQALSPPPVQLSFSVVTTTAELKEPSLSGTGSPVLRFSVVTTTAELKERGVGCIVAGYRQFLRGHDHGRIEGSCALGFLLVTVRVSPWSRPRPN